MFVLVSGCKNNEFCSENLRRKIRKDSDLVENINFLDLLNGCSRSLVLMIYFLSLLFDFYI